MWCFPRQVGICQKENSVTEDTALALRSQRKSRFPTTAGSSVLWRMLRPLLADVYLLRLDVSVHVVLVTLDVSLTRAVPRIIPALSTQQYHLKRLTCLVFAVPKLLMYMSYSLTGGRSKMEKVTEKSRSMRRSSSALRFLEPQGRFPRYIKTSEAKAAINVNIKS